MRSRSSRSSVLPAVLLVFVGCQFQASCGSNNLNMDKAREFVRSTLEKEVGQVPTAVTCPDKVPIKKDTTFECTVAFGAPVATIVIQQNSDKGDVTIKSITGILIASKLEAQIAEQIGNRLNVAISVACGARVRIAKVGDSFECNATDQEGVTGKVAVVVEDTTGKVKFAIVPPPEPGGGGDGGDE